MDYKFRKNSGALNEAAGAGPGRYEDDNVDITSNVGVFSQGRMSSAIQQQQRSIAPPRGIDRRSMSFGGIFFYTVREGERVLVTQRDGRVHQVEGPTRFWRWGSRVDHMVHHLAHPGEFLIVRFRDGRQEHLAGPAHLWEDPTIHHAIEREESLHISAKEAVVVYSRSDTNEVVRRIVHGPATFIPAPGEWLHTFSWHGTKGGQGGYHKVPNGLIFQKVWQLPDQMYHDVNDVRTADDAVLTVRLMIFFVLEDLPQMLETTHDPIGDFINAATSDIIAFTSRHSFEAFKEHTQALNELSTYTQLVARADQCGYRITKVVYRGYGAPDSLQRMHDEAIESRTRLQLERATQQQAQDLEDFTLERTLARAARQRQEQELSLQHDLEVSLKKRAAEILDQTERRAAARVEERQDAQQRAEISREDAVVEEKRLSGFKELGVDLTAFLCKTKVDRLIEVRGTGPVHVESR